MKSKPRFFCCRFLLIILILITASLGLAPDVYAIATYDVYGEIDIAILSFYNLDLDITTDTLPDGMTVTFGTTGDPLYEYAVGNATAAAENHSTLIDPTFDYILWGSLSGTAEYAPDSFSHTSFDTTGLGLGTITFENNSEYNWLVEYGYQYQGYFAGSISDPADPDVDEYSEVSWFYRVEDTTGGTVDELLLEGEYLKAYSSGGYIPGLPYYESPGAPFQDSFGAFIAVLRGDTGGIRADLKLTGYAAADGPDIPPPDGGGGGGGTTTVPEPSTLLLFGTGLVGIGVLRRKFKG